MIEMKRTRHKIIRIDRKSIKNSANIRDILRNRLANLSTLGYKTVFGDLRFIFIPKTVYDTQLC